MAEGFGKGTTPESKPATNRNQANTDFDRGLELLLSIMLAMGYRSTAFLPVLPMAVRLAIVDQLIQDASAKLIATSRLLAEGRIKFRAWLIQMRDILVASLAAGTLAVAGKEEPSDAEKEAWISETNLQYGYLVGFYKELTEGRQQFNQALIGRSDLYARAIWAVAWRVWVAEQLSGKELFGEQVDARPYGKRTLGIADHCADCIAWSQLPWLPLEEVPPIGSSVCGARCRCTIEIEWR